MKMSKTSELREMIDRVKIQTDDDLLKSIEWVIDGEFSKDKENDEYCELVQYIKIRVLEELYHEVNTKVNR
jgi:hypothetical protein